MASSQAFGGVDVAGYAVEDLAAQHGLPLFGDETFLGQSHIAQHVEEALAIELAVHGLQIRIGRDVPCDLGIGNAEPHLPGALVEPGLADHFAEHLPVEAESRSPVRAAADGRIRGSICCKRSL